MLVDTTETRVADGGVEANCAQIGEYIKAHEIEHADATAGTLTGLATVAAVIVGALALPTAAGPIPAAVATFGMASARILTWRESMHSKANVDAGDARASCESAAKLEQTPPSGIDTRPPPVTDDEDDTGEQADDFFSDDTDSTEQCSSKTTHVIVGRCETTCVEHMETDGCYITCETVCS